MCQSDGECVRRCLDGRPEAFRHLVRRYQGPLSRHLAGRLGTDEQVAEAAQETFVRAYFALGKLKKPDSFWSWLLGIAGRVTQESRRARRRQREVLPLHVEAVAQHGNTAADEPAGSIASVSLAVANLPELYRQVILLRFYGGLSCAEIGRELDVPLGTVTKRLSRAYALLRESLPAPRPEETEV